MDETRRTLPEAGPIVIATVLETTAARALDAVRAVPEGCAVLELRADHLRRAEVEGIIRRSGRSVLVTVRRAEDGGGFDGTEEERRGLLEGAIAAGAAGVDVEHGSSLAPWAEGLDPRRVLLSRHGGPCDARALRLAAREMEAHPARFRKLAPSAASPAQVVAIRDFLSEARERKGRTAAFALGGAGLLSRVLAPLWGSWATYGSAAALPAAPGQPRASDLLDMWRVLEIGETTLLFGLAGRPVLESPSPAMHAAAYRVSSLDAVYVPIEGETLEEVLSLCGPGGSIPFRGIGVTIPLKEDAARGAARRDPTVAASGAANTLRFDEEGTFAANTDGPALLALVRDRLDPRGARAAILGAGGAARAAAAVLRRAGVAVTLFNRTAERARGVANALRVAWEPLDRLRGASWDLLVQATPLGREGEEVLPPDALRGRLVVDMAYGRGPTPLVLAAREAGLAAVDGLEFLAAQAALQFAVLTGRSVPVEVLAEARDRWLGPRLDAGDTRP